MLTCFGPLIIACNGLPTIAIWCLKTRDEDLMVATHGKGRWTVSLSEITNVEMIQVRCRPDSLFH